jgi:Domain of unknown function (DUF4263)
MSSEDLIAKLRLRTFNTKDLLNDPKIREPWPDNFVDWNRPEDPRTLDELEKILNEAEDERPLQAFYTAHPYFLANIFQPHCCWLFPKPRLGGEYIPDFLYCDHNSLGYAWTIIELESPKMEATNKDGSVSADCHHAVGQILDYRRWLTENALAVQKKYPSLNDRCEGVVVIGRRDSGRTELEQSRLADFRQQRIEIASYDRLLYQARERLRHINGSWESAAELAQKVQAKKESEPLKGGS